MNADTPPNVRRKLHSTTARSLTSAIDQQPSATVVWPSDWITFRHSIAEIDRRSDRGDVAVVCADCGCELDSGEVPVPHSPRCPEWDT